MSARSPRDRAGSRRARGRPREFDPDEALDGALRVFWRRGYEGASVGELTGAMRISRPSLYAAFGDKETLFLKALDRYALLHAPMFGRALEAPTARETAYILLYGTAEFLAGKENPPGCLFTQTLLSCGAQIEHLRGQLNARRMSGFVHLRKRFRRAKVDGDLPKRADAAELALFVTVMVFGMGVLSVCGATRRELLKVVDTALRAWPAAIFATVIHLVARSLPHLNLV